MEWRDADGELLRRILGKPVDFYRTTPEFMFIYDPFVGGRVHLGRTTQVEVTRWSVRAQNGLSAVSILCEGGPKTANLHVVGATPPSRWTITPLFYSRRPIPFSAGCADTEHWKGPRPRSCTQINFAAAFQALRLPDRPANRHPLESVSPASSSTSAAKMLGAGSGVPERYDHQRRHHT